MVLYRKKMKNSAQYHDGEDLGHPCIQSTMLCFVIHKPPFLSLTLSQLTSLVLLIPCMAPLVSQTALLVITSRLASRLPSTWHRSPPATDPWSLLCTCEDVRVCACVCVCACVVMARYLCQNNFLYKALQIGRESLLQRNGCPEN